MIVKSVHIIILTLREYRNEVFIKVRFAIKSPYTLNPEYPSANKNENNSPIIALPYAPTIANVARPSPVSITGIENSIKLKINPMGSPMI